MIYDRPLFIARLGEGSSPLERRLQVVGRHYCAELSIYGKTYFEWQQTGESIDRMVQLPRLGMIDATMYAVDPAARCVWRILQAQAAKDDDGQPVWRLSLQREEARYDIFDA